MNTDKLLEDERLYTAKRRNKCRVCGLYIMKGEEMAWSPHFVVPNRNRHLDCVPEPGEVERHLFKTALFNVKITIAPYRNNHQFMAELMDHLVQTSPAFEGGIRYLNEYFGRALLLSLLNLDHMAAQGPLEDEDWKYALEPGISLEDLRDAYVCRQDFYKGSEKGE